MSHERSQIVVIALLLLLGCWGFINAQKPPQLTPVVPSPAEVSLAQISKDIATIADVFRTWQKHHVGAAVVPSSTTGDSALSSLPPLPSIVLSLQHATITSSSSSSNNPHGLETQWYIPKKNPELGKTKSGLQLWDYELPYTGASDRTTVVLKKNWTALAEREVQQRSGQRARKGSFTANNLWRPPTIREYEGEPHAAVSIEYIDKRIRLKAYTFPCKKKPNDDSWKEGEPETMSQCYRRVFDQAKKKLEDAVTSALQPLAWSIAIPSTARRFYFDIGARDWDSGSTKWFVEHYPGSEEFQGVAFEMDKRFESTFPKEKLNSHFKQGWEFVNAAVWIHEDGVEWSGTDMGSVLDKAGAAGAALSENMGGHKVADGPVKVRSIDVAKLFTQNFTMEDFVVVKMDIEGAEWPIVQRMIETGAIKYIDEMFFECHVSEVVEGMHPRCIDAMNLLRSLGVVCHRWI
jgi:FkbM family methyltransferase